MKLSETQRRFNYYSYPGCSELAGNHTLIDYKTETLSDCLARIYSIDEANLLSRKRDREISDARHMMRYFLAKIGWKNADVAKVTNCYDPVNGSRAYYNSLEKAECLVKHDKSFSENFEYLNWKHSKNLLILPK